MLKAAAWQRLAAGQGELDLGLDGPAAGRAGPLPITASRMGHLWDALEHAESPPCLVTKQSPRRGAYSRRLPSAELDPLPGRGGCGVQG